MARSAYSENLVVNRDSNFKVVSARHINGHININISDISNSIQWRRNVQKKKNKTEMRNLSA